MGFKEAEGLFHQIIIRAVPWVPPGWKSKTKKGHCAENQVVVTVLVGPNSVTDPQFASYLFMRHRNMDFTELWTQGVQISPKMPV